jgi:D-glycero-alpha-D-manno-heptose-7-phosphate kinase
LGFAGGGSDVEPYCSQFGGLVINATIDMYAYCTIEVTNDNMVVFEATDRGELFRSKSKSLFKIDRLLSLHKGVYNRVVSTFNNGKPLSFRMTTHSDAPAGSGLGSSSTMVVAILKGYVEWLNLPLGDYEIARLAYEIERKDVGLNGGKQDQYATTFGGFNFMEFYEKDRVIINPLRIKNWILDELESSLILCFTGTSRDSKNIINEQADRIKSNDKV